jgi:metal-sulfur cluster biosynthetic enzyme
MMVEDAKSKVSEVEGINEVDVELTFDPPWDPSKASEEVRRLLGI